jgi:hypothetical protein
MSSSTDAPGTNGRLSQLNGWKDIAAYLGRSVRTVQRWEGLRLPGVLRGLEAGECTALPYEVDAAADLTGRTPSGNADAIVARADAAVGARGVLRPRARAAVPARRFLRMGLVAAVEVVVLLLLWTLWTSLQPPRRMDTPQGQSSSSAAPASWHVDLDTLIVSDARGAELWRHRFSRELVAQAYDDSAARPRMLVGGVADIEGDGSREVWFISRAHGAPAGSALHLFNSDGTSAGRSSRSRRCAWRRLFAVRIVDRAFVTADLAGGQAAPSGPSSSTPRSSRRPSRPDPATEPADGA